MNINVCPYNYKSSTYIFFEAYLLHPVGYLRLPVVLHHVEALARNVSQVAVRHLVQPRDYGGKVWPLVTVEPPAVLHQQPPVLGACAGDVKVELVHGDPVRDGHVVDALVGRLAREQFPQNDPVAARIGLVNIKVTMCIFFSLPPHVGTLAKSGSFNDLWRHPGIGSRSRYFGRVINLSRQTEVSDF